MNTYAAGPPARNETDMLPHIIALAQQCGWLVQHARPARTAKGWQTPIQGDAGFPDLCMVRGGRLIFAELKSTGKQPGPEQREWLDRLQVSAGVELYVWRPDSWNSGAIAEVLA